MLINTHNWIARCIEKIQARFRSPGETRSLYAKYKEDNYNLNRDGDYIYVGYPKNIAPIEPIYIDVLYTGHLD